MIYCLPTRANLVAKSKKRFFRKTWSSYQYGFFILLLLADALRLLYTQDYMSDPAAVLFFVQSCGIVQNFFTFALYPQARKMRSVSLRESLEAE